MTKVSQLKWVSRRLNIRPYKLSDYECWFSAVTQDCELNKTNKTKDSFKKKVSRNRQLAKEDRSYIFGIFDKKSNQHLGEIEINIITRSNFHWASLGYQIHKHCQNNGFAKEAALSVLKIGHKALDLKRIEAVIPKTNKRSLRVARSIKMKSEGVRREFIPMEEGWVDALVFASVR